MAHQAHQLEDKEQLVGGEAVQIVHDDQDGLPCPPQGLFGLPLGRRGAGVSADAVAESLDQAF